MKNTKSTKATAYHEAGHAVVCHRLGYQNKRITIVPNGTSLGECSHEKIIRGDLDFDGSERKRVRIDTYIMICLAGNIAQRIWRASSVRSYHAMSDHQRAVDWAIQINGSGPVASAYLKWLHLRTKQLLESSWQTVEALAADLLKEGTITIKQTSVKDTVTAEKIKFFWR